MKGLLRTINNVTEYQNSLSVIGYTLTELTESVEIYCIRGFLFNLLNKAKSSKPVHIYPRNLGFFQVIVREKIESNIILGALTKS